MMPEQPTTISESTARALRLISDQERLRFYDHRTFAKQMWPDSEGWSRHAKVGRGSNKGGGMALAAGGFLGKLRRQGLITYFKKSSGLRSYQLTAKGEQALAAWEAAQQPADTPTSNEVPQ